MRSPRKVRLLKHWGFYNKGHVFTDMGHGQATTLIERNIAEYVDEEVKAAPVNRAMSAGKGRQVAIERARNV